MDDIAVAGYAVAALVHLAFAGYVIGTGRAHVSERRAPAVFAAAIVASGIWCGAEAASALWRSPLWPGLAATFDTARYGLWLGLLSTLVGHKGGQATMRTVSSVRLLLVIAFGAAATLQLIRIAAGLADAAPTKIVVGTLLALPLCGLFLVEQVFRGLGDDSRWHAKPLCLGLAVVFVFDIYMWSEALMFGHADPDALAARGPVHMLAVPAMFIGARRQGDWISRLQVSRSAAFHSATLVLAGIYLLLMSAIGYYVRYFGGSWGRALQLSLVFAAVAFMAALALSTALRSRLRVFVGKHFFSYRFDYREQWLRFTATLAEGGTQQDVGQNVIQGLAHMVECPAGSLWTHAESGAPYTQRARWNMAAVTTPEPADSTLCHFLREKAWVVDLDEFRSAPRRYEGLGLPTWLLGAGNAWLVVPLLAGDDLLGFVVLAHPRTPIDLNWEVLDLLKTASRQAAAHLAQMQATEALLEARKFDAFNRMSAFVVHDLKNIVTQLSLMLKNAERLHDNREFQQDMLLTVESSLEKMRRLMLQLREGAAPPGGSHGVDVEPIVRRLQAMAQAQSRQLEVRHLERVATRGHDDRLERVLGHLVQNALDATPADGRVWIQVERFSGQVKIEVGDTGAGMSEEFVQTRLFKPFSSTKRSGMGVGSYESAQYIRELGGSIRVASRVGEGTTMTVLLPLFETAHGSDLARAGAI